MEEEVKKLENNDVKEDKKISKKAEILIIIFTIIAVIGCYFLAFVIQKTEVNSKIKKELNDLKYGNFDKTGMKETEAEVYSAFYKNLEYKIIDTEADFSKAKVKVIISNKDMSKVLSKYYDKAEELGIELNQDTINLNEEIELYLLELLNSDEIESVETEVEVSLSKASGVWDFDDENMDYFYSAILPGM